MRLAGLSVVPLFDEFDRGTPDPVWLPVVTRRGWILLTKDDKWRYRHEEMMILIRAKARAFVFTSKTAKREQIAECVVKAIPAIERVINRIDPPFIAKILLSGQIVVIHPKR